MQGNDCDGASVSGESGGCLFQVFFFPSRWLAGSTNPRYISASNGGQHATSGVRYLDSNPFMQWMSPTKWNGGGGAMPIWPMVRVLSFLTTPPSSLRTILLVM